jgi:hypothetical protein
MHSFCVIQARQGTRPVDRPDVCLPEIGMFNTKTEGFTVAWQNGVVNSLAYRLAVIKQPIPILVSGA